MRIGTALTACSTKRSTVFIKWTWMFKGSTMRVGPTSPPFTPNQYNPVTIGALSAKILNNIRVVLWNHRNSVARLSIVSVNKKPLWFALCTVCVCGVELVETFCLATILKYAQLQTLSNDSCDVFPYILEEKDLIETRNHPFGLLPTRVYSPVSQAVIVLCLYAAHIFSGPWYSAVTSLKWSYGGCNKISLSTAGVGNLTTITGPMNCALSLAGRKIN